MQDSDPIPSTPTPRQVSEQHNGSHVFSSPARDVGWSPSAANAPLGGLLYEHGTRRGSDVHQIFDSSISPIRRTSWFSLDYPNATRPDAPPSAQQGKPQKYDLDAREPPKDACSCAPQPPPSTPQSIGRSIFHPVASLSVRSPQYDTYDPRLDDDGSPSKAKQQADFSSAVRLQSPSTRVRFPPHYSFSSSYSPGLPASFPYKSQSAPIFPPPASPPLFASSSTTPTHTFVSSTGGTIFELNHLSPRSGSPQPSPTRAHSPPSVSFPSATPLENDPFLVAGRSNDTEGQPPFLFGVRAGVRTGILENVEDANASIQVPPPEAEVLPAASQDLHATFGTRKRSAKMRMAVLDSHARVTKKSSRKSKISSRSWRDVSPTDSKLPTASVAPLPSSFFSGISSQFSSPPVSSSSAPDRAHHNYLIEPSQTRVSAASPTHDPVSDHTFVDPDVPRALLPTASTKFSFSTPAINRDDNDNPSATPRYMFPTPSLTAASFASPLTISDLATPTGTGLFPSPEIVGSPSTPLNFGPRTFRGKGGRGRMVAGYATPTPIAVLRSACDLVESTATNSSVLDPKDTLNQRPEENENAAAYNQTGSAAHLEAVCTTEIGQVNSDQGFDQLTPTVSPSDAVSEACGGNVTEFRGVPAPCVDPPATQGELSSTSTPAKRTRELSVDGDIQTEAKAARKGNSTAHNEAILSDVYFERSTRSQARAVAALLALAASSPRDSSRREATVKDTAPQVVDTKISETRRSQTRSRPIASETRPTPTTRKPRKKGVPTRRAVVGRAPSKVVGPTIGGTTKFPSETPTRHEARHNSDFPNVEPGTISSLPHTHAEEKTIEGDEKGAQGEGEVEGETPKSPGKHQVPSELLPRPSRSIVYKPNGEFTQRTFPSGFPIHENCSKWYRRFPVPAYFQESDPARKFIFGERVATGAAAIPRAPGSSRLIPNPAAHFNLYTPRFVRGVGTAKVGLCTICVEPAWRGGEGNSALYNTKISAYNYHMQYYHGISPRTGLPFSPPIAFRHVSRSHAKTQERTMIEQGKCHACQKWIPIESFKEMEVMVPELYWWKHAASCHGISRLPGDQDPYIEDSVFLRLREYKTKTEVDAPEAKSPVKLGDPSVELGTEGSPSPIQVGSATQNGLSVLDMDSDSDLTDLEEAVDMDISDDDVRI